MMPETAWANASTWGFVFCPWGSAVWPQCWLCAVCAVGHIGCCVGGEYPVGVSISSSSRQWWSAHLAQGGVFQGGRGLFMVVSRCRGIGPPFSGIVLGTLLLLAADLRRHPTSAHPYPVSSVVLVCLSRAGFLTFPAPFPCRVSISQESFFLFRANARERVSKRENVQTEGRAHTWQREWWFRVDRVCLKIVSLFDGLRRNPQK